MGFMIIAMVLDPIRALIVWGAMWAFKGFPGMAAGIVVSAIVAEAILASARVTMTFGDYLFPGLIASVLLAGLGYLARHIWRDLAPKRD